MLLQQFQQHLKTNFNGLSPADNKLLLAVSGGIDSTVMTDLFFRSGFDFVMAHCNFQLRNEESIRDELFVRALGEKYNKQVFVKRFDTKLYADENKISVQEAARELRYEWFAEIINGNRKTSNVNDTGGPITNSQSPITFLSTAHNADDNIETMLMFLFRGTGIHGLTGIKAHDKKRKIIRPLLFAARSEIAAYAAENNITWVEDSSNAVYKYTRNFFRHAIIPAVEKHYPNTLRSLIENIDRFKDAEQLYLQAIEAHKKRLIEIKGNEIHIPVLKLQKSKPLDTILWEIIKDFNFHAQQIDEVKKLFNADNSSYVQSQSHKIIKNRKWLIIAPVNTKNPAHILIEANNEKIIFSEGILNFEKLTAHSSKPIAQSLLAQLDAKHIQFPLMLRKWKQGDYFYPLGMRKKKKLSRFFIDEKLSATEKENAWVLEMDKKIVWIVGYRIDDRFKITNTTKKVLKISFTAAQKH